MVEIDELHEMPTHHNLDCYLEEDIAAAVITDDRKDPLFRTTRDRSGELTGNPMTQPDVSRMIRRRSPLESRPRSDVIRSAPPGLLPTLKTGADWRWRSRWPHTKVHEPPVSMHERLRQR